MLNQIQSKRIEVVDSIRGFALLGVIFANVPYKITDTNESSLNNIIDLLIDLLVSQKFITIFSILFGFGFYIQLNRHMEPLGKFKRYFLKRMFLLFLIGAIHCYLIWNGDILMSYAIGGVFLLLIRKCSKRSIFLLAIFFNIIITGVFFIGNSVLEWQTYSYDYNLVSKINTTNSFISYLKMNFTTAPWTNFLKDVPITLSYSFGNMLIGFLLGKIQFFNTSINYKKLKNVLILLGFTLGLTTSYLYHQININSIVLTNSMIWVPFVIIGGIILQSLGYISLFIKLYNLIWFKNFLKYFRYIGKTALTNYIFQSIFYLIVVFHCTQGFQLFGKITRAETYLIAIIFFIFQIINSCIWLKIKSQGPIEYIWKTITKDK